jgi:hypothetical protein
MSIQEPERLAFQIYCDSLMADFGATIVVDFGVGDSLFIPVAGIRVLEATPLFDRHTGAVQAWRYYVLFAEMSVLDVLNTGHPVQAFRGVVTERRGHFCWLKETDGDKRFLISRNDPHLDERQQAVYKEWDGAVIHLGGEEKLQEILDVEARVRLARDKEAAA